MFYVVCFINSFSKKQKWILGTAFVAALMYFVGLLGYVYVY
jgi:flagellar biosynthesis/type III secretory pathway M-ring protein FliF/YscJ